jgi:phytoene synthase
MGYAFQLTNILRDVGSDLQEGRVYLPNQDIEEAGYSVSALIHREHNAEFLALMNKEYKRAKNFYRQARNCLDSRDRPLMLPAEIMARVYEDILERLKATDFPVFHQRAKLSPWRKARMALSGLAYSYSII